MSKISKIDNLIARCNSCQDIRIAKCIQRDAISVLKELKCSNEVIQSCRDVFFGKEEVDEFDVKQYGFNSSVAMQSITLDKGLKSMISILNDIRLIVEREDNYTSQNESIKWAKIAAWAGIGSVIIGLASIAFSIFLYLCNN